MSAQPNPVVCVSYLAHAALWKVPRFPQANHGAEVLTIENSIAASMFRSPWWCQWRSTRPGGAGWPIMSAMTCRRCRSPTPGCSATASRPRRRRRPRRFHRGFGGCGRQLRQPRAVPASPGVADSRASLDLSSIGCASFVAHILLTATSSIERPAIPCSSGGAGSPASLSRSTGAAPRFTMGWGLRGHGDPRLSGIERTSMTM